MNQLKPYLFWVVIGLVLLVELTWWILSIPDIDAVGNKADAQKAKKTLDAEYLHLEELDKRAKSGSPTGVFDAEKAADIKNLTDNYLITPEWKKILDPHVKRYDEQLLAIKTHLASRSKGLRRPIADSGNKFEWYTAYQNATEAQLKLLYEANALVMPSTKAGSKTTAAATNMTPPGGTPAAAVAQPIAAATGPDFATDAAVRSLAGFFTKGADLPEPTQHDQLTRQFRTMERIIAVILSTTASDRPNPLAAVDEVPVASHAAMAGVSWTSSQAAVDTTIGGDAGRYATGWRLTLTLHGPLSAVLSAMAALEHPHETNSPLMEVVSAQVTRKGSFVSGERKDTGSESVVARIELLVLDFTDAPTGAKPAAVQPGRPGGPNMSYPGTGGIPPGMGGMGGGVGKPPTGVPPNGQPPASRQPSSTSNSNRETGE